MSGLWQGFKNLVGLGEKAAPAKTQEQIEKENLGVQSKAALTIAVLFVLLTSPEMYKFLESFGLRTVAVDGAPSAQGRLIVSVIFTLAVVVALTFFYEDYSFDQAKIEANVKKMMNKVLAVTE